MKKDFSNYKFRASSLPCLMTNSRTKDALSETAKTCLREIWIKEVFGREKLDSKSKYTDKGIACESDSLDLLKTVTGKTYFKNQKTLENDFICGTPDVITTDKIIDIKTSWDIWTFSAVDSISAEKDYLYQLIGYMWLTNIPNAELVYCLVDTPEDIINGELYRLNFRYSEIDSNPEFAEKVKKNYLFSDIDPSLRVKTYTFNIEVFEPLLLVMQEKLIRCREYLNSLSL